MRRSRTVAARELLALVGGLLLVAMVGTRGAAAAGTFVDDDASVHEAAIEELAAAGVTAGCDMSGDRYCPAASVTRAQMASFLLRALEAVDVPVPDEARDRFPDDEGSVHERNIDRLAAMGVVKGGADGLYHPRDSVTRGQMALFLQRAFELPAGDPAGFVDVGPVHAAAVDAIAAAEITRGCTLDGARYCPRDAVRRDQMASFLVRSMAHVGGTTTTTASTTSDTVATSSTVATTLPTIPTTLPTIPTTLPTVPTTLPTVPTTLPTVPTTLVALPTTTSLTSPGGLPLP